MDSSKRPTGMVHYVSAAGVEHTVGLLLETSTQPVVVYARQDPANAEDVSRGSNAEADIDDFVFSSSGAAGDAALGLYTALIKAIRKGVEGPDPSVRGVRQPGCSTVLLCPLSFESGDFGNSSSEDEVDEAQFPVFLERSSSIQTVVDGILGELHAAARDSITKNRTLPSRSISGVSVKGQSAPTQLTHSSQTGDPLRLCRHRVPMTNGASVRR